MSEHATPAAVPSPHPADGLDDDELAAIEAALGRAPNALERALFGAAWSEQRSRKSSRALLGTLPAGGALVGAGHGNAGVIRIGDGWTAAITFGPDARRPAPEPGGDAANGIGAVVRDLLATGARPIAVLAALRAGEPADPRTRALVRAARGGASGFAQLRGRPADARRAASSTRLERMTRSSSPWGSGSSATMRSSAAAPAPGRGGPVEGIDGSGGGEAGAPIRPRGPAVGARRGSGRRSGERPGHAGLVDATLEVVGSGLADRPERARSGRHHRRRR